MTSVVLTEELYEANIPKCCELKTYREHCDVVGICWGLVRNIKDSKVTKCGICDFNTEMTDADRKEYWAKQRTWSILNQ